MEKMKCNGIKRNEIAILSVRDLLRLQAMPIVDDKKYVIQTITAKPVPVVNVSHITEEQRRQYFRTSKDSKDTILAKKMRQAVKEIETGIAYKNEQAAIQEKETLRQKEDASSEFDFRLFECGLPA
ncbi:MAG: hypothetical protein LBG95_04260 [Treponema sp.]|jgi:chemotaxis response regulator CheB|nr:hypothetical protein [Treponema sp.]